MYNILYCFQQYTPTFKKFGLLEKSDVDKLFKTVEVILNLHKIGQIEMGDKFSQWYTHEKIGALFNFVSVNFLQQFKKLCILGS